MNTYVITPYIRVVPFGFSPTAQGIYYAVSELNPQNVIIQFEAHLNDPFSNKTHFDIIGCTDEQKHYVCNVMQGVNAVQVKNGLIVLSGGDAHVTHLPKAIAIVPRFLYKSMSHKVFNFERLSVLMSIVSYVVDLDIYLTRDTHIFMPNSSRYRSNLINNHVKEVCLAHKYVAKFSGNLLSFDDRKMYGMHVDFSDPNLVDNLFRYLLQFTSQHIGD